MSNTTLRAARITDLHKCPTGGDPGGDISTGEPTVLIEGQPAARIGDAAKCKDGPTKIGTGSPTVIIGGSKAARITDKTCHHGQVTTGAATVFIGDGGAGGSGAMNAAKSNAAPFVRAG